MRVRVRVRVRVRARARVRVRVRVTVRVRVRHGLTAVVQDMSNGRSGDGPHGHPALGHGSGGLQG